MTLLRLFVLVSGLAIVTAAPLGNQITACAAGCDPRNYLPNCTGTVLPGQAPCHGTTSAYFTSYSADNKIRYQAIAPFCYNDDSTGEGPSTRRALQGHPPHPRNDCFGLEYNAVYAESVATGEVLWKWENLADGKDVPVDEGSYIGNIVVSSPGHLVCEAGVGRSHVIFALSAIDGSFKWFVQDPCDNCGGSFMQGRYGLGYVIGSADGKTVYLHRTNREHTDSFTKTVYAMSMDDGATLWHTNDPRYLTPLGLLPENSIRGSLFEAPDGKSLIVSGNAVDYSCENRCHPHGFLYSVSTADGKINWNITTSYPDVQIFVTTGVFSADGATLYAAGSVVSEGPHRNPGVVAVTVADGTVLSAVESMCPENKECNLGRVHMNCPDCNPDNQALPFCQTLAKWSAVVPDRDGRLDVMPAGRGSPRVEQGKCAQWCAVPAYGADPVLNSGGSTIYCREA